MRLLIFSDIHGNRRALQRLLDTEADYYFAAGDLATFSRGLDRVGPLMRPKGDRTYVLPGNHESEADIDRFCEEFGCLPFHGRSIQLGGWNIAGLGYSSPTPFDTPGEYSEEEIERRLQPFAGLHPLVLICHCPPMNTDLSKIRDGLYAGSTSIAKFLDENQPEYFFCGHIHEAEGKTVHIGRTLAVNVGEAGYLLDL